MESDDNNDFSFAPISLRSSESGKPAPTPKVLRLAPKGAKQQGDRRQRQPTPPLCPKCCGCFAQSAKQHWGSRRPQSASPPCPKWRVVSRPRRENSDRDKALPQPRPSFSPTIRGRTVADSRVNLRGHSAGRKNPRRTQRSGGSSCPRMSAKVSPQILRWETQASLYTVLSFNR